MGDSPEPSPIGHARGRLLYVVNVDWFFLSHRLSLARAAREAGFEVHIAAADTGRGADIRREGFDFLPLPLTRHMGGIGAEIRALYSLASLYRRLKPDIIHQVSIKPVLYGSLVARLLGHRAVVNAVSGLGYVFTSRNRAILLRRFTRLAYYFALRHRGCYTIFQNPDDRAEFVERGLVHPGRAILIRGSGVDCTRFHARPEPDGPPIVMLAGRMIWDKGIQSFVDAARHLHSRVDARFVLVGPVDGAHPTAVPLRQLGHWEREGIIEWWGNRVDMAETIGQASIVVLPSKREGLPKILLEAAACGKPIVATDVPGCREVVRHEVTGLLVPAGDSAALAEAIERLVASPHLRQAYGRAGCDWVASEFAEHVVIQQTLDLYNRLCSDAGPDNDGGKGR